MTQLTQGEHTAQMEDMRQFDEQMPCAGIFWYDPADKAFFGMYKQELMPKMVEVVVDEVFPFINYPKLHRQVWAKEYFKVQAKHEKTSTSSKSSSTPLSGKNGAGFAPEYLYEIGTAA